jgi:hypothetical protein
MAKAQETIQSSLDAIRKSSAAEALMTGADYAIEFAKGFADKIMSAIDQGDALGKLAQRVGTTTEALSALQYAGKFAGVSSDDLTTAFKGLNKALLDARDPLSDSAAAVRSLGLNVKTLQGEDPSKAFEDIAEAFSKYADGAEKSAVATQLFGKQGQALIPMLNEGKEGLGAAREEAERLGLIVSGTTARAMGDLNDDIERLKNVSEGAAATIAGQLTTSLDMLVTTLSGATSEGNAWNEALKFIGQTINDLILDLTSLAAEIAIVWRELQGYGDAVKQFFAGDFRAALETTKAAANQSNASMDELTARMNKAKSLQREMADHPLDLGNPTAGWDEKPAVKFTAALDANAASAKKAKKEVDEYSKMLNDLNAKMVALKSGGDPMAEMVADPKFQKFSAQQQESLKQLMQSYIDLKASMDGAKQAQADIDKQQQDAAAANAAWLKSLQDSAKAHEDANDPLRVYEATIAQLNDEMTYAGLSQQAYNQQVKEAGDTFDEAYKKLHPMSDGMQDITKTIADFGRTATDSFVDFATGADNLGDSFRKMVADMLTQLAKVIAYQYVFKNLFNSASTGFAGWAQSAIPSLFSATAGGGQSVSSSSNAMLLGRSAVSTGGGGGSTGGSNVAGGVSNPAVQVNVHVHKDDRETQDTTANDKTAAELGNRIAAVCRQVISTEKRSGGLLAS